MKKKLLTRLIAFALLVAMTVSLSGCFLYKIIPSLCPHNWKENVTVQATCKTVGKKELKCDTCGQEKTEEIPKTSHVFSSEWKFDGQNHWHKCDTCDEKSQVGTHQLGEAVEGVRTCSICSYTVVEAKGAISFHFMMLGNENTGDSIYVKAGDNDILIDAGSRENSIDDIKNYIDNYVTDGKLEYVIATHADQDHIAGFAKSNGSIFDLYECETIIDFPLTDKNTATYQRYVVERDDEVELGAKHYTALECYNNQNGAKRTYNLTEDGNVKFEILYNYYYENRSDDENNYSVCIMFYHGSRQFLFTGDLEKEGEEQLAKFYDFSQVELFKAGHHGSYTSSNEGLLSEIKPKMSVVCCCAGSIERKTAPRNLFPSQDYIDRISKYTDKVFVPSAMEIIQTAGADTPNDTKDDLYDNEGESFLLNGNIQVISDATNGVYVECSNNNTLLKDTKWFKKYRTMPDAWKSVS